MHTATSSIGRLNKPQRIVIDWSDLNTASLAHDGEHDIEELLGWVHTYPSRSDIHVYLRALKRDTSHRQLKSRLQSLGCTVTVKNVAMRSAAAVKTVSTDFLRSAPLARRHHIVLN